MAGNWNGCMLGQKSTLQNQTKQLAVHEGEREAFDKHVNRTDYKQYQNKEEGRFWWWEERGERHNKHYSVTYYYLANYKHVTKSFLPFNNVSSL